jgi:hypothetical protein|tara:strand:+ start:144 stop:302 length:159 start_codon:yes stop_codon:yes gene_type:complete
MSTSDGSDSIGVSAWLVSDEHNKKLVNNSEEIEERFMAGLLGKSIMNHGSRK